MWLIRNQSTTATCGEKTQKHYISSLIAVCPKKGKFTAARIKKTYPSKIVARYSSTEEHSIFVNDVELLDGKFGKNDDFQTYLDFIQQYAKKH